MSMKIGFFGSSHLSIVSAICAAKKVRDIGGTVFCYIGDDDIFGPDRTLRIKEPQLEELLKECGSNISFVADPSALTECDIVYVALDTPTNDQGEADLSPVEKAVIDVIPFLSSTALLVIHSQVTPCFTRKITLPHDRLFYQVETLIFGRGVERALYPERFIVGAKDKETQLPEIYQKYLSLYGCPIFSMAYESAELAKISINLFLTASVSTSNTLAEVCETINADWADIAKTLRLDKRIGQYAYLKPGLGISGGNLERDLVAIKRLAYEKGIRAELIDAELSSSKYYKNWALRTLKDKILSEKPNITVGILGLAYKENTNSIKNSPSVQLIRQLSTSKIYAYDPVIKSLPADTHSNIQLCDTAAEVIKNSQVLLIMTPWDEFKVLELKHYSCPIVDPYNLIDKEIHPYTVYQRGS